MGGGVGICPWLVNEICPAHIHIFLQVLVSAGIPSIIKSGLPGIHGVVTTGTQGAGVNTPMAAAVAEITAGLEGDEHMPKVEMLTPGAKSLTFNFGMFDKETILEGLAIKGQGLVPNEQLIIAEDVT